MKRKQPYHSNPPNEIHVKYDDPLALSHVSKGIVELLPLEENMPVVITCIGTDRSTGDSFGPLIGSFLKEIDLNHFHVYGTLDDPIHAVNLQERINQIHEHHINPFIIAIDACLGRIKNVGVIKVGTGPIKPGAGVNKDLPSVGHIHITGIVNVSGYMEFFVLQNTRLNLVMRMAKQVTAGIEKADQLYSQKYFRYQMELDESKESFF